MKGFFIVSLLIAIAVSACSSEDIGKILDDSKIYYIVFEDKPDISSEIVLSKGFSIGKILSQTLGQNNLVIIKVAIEKKMVNLMTSNAVFYGVDGALTYDLMEDTGAVLPEESKILGFPSKTSMYWFKTKHTVSELSGSAIKRAEELYKQSID